jgi:hypothetical protein
MFRTLGALAGAVAAIAAPSSLAQDMNYVDLGWDTTLEITENSAARTVRLRLSTLEHDLHSVEFANAAFAPETLQTVRLCADCPEVHFLSIDNLLVAQEDTIGVLVYESVPGGWTIMILPFDRPFVSDADGDGVFDLVSNPWTGEPQRYDFRAGLLGVAR